MDALKAEKPDYTAWSQEELIKRVTSLENELKLKNSSIQAPLTERKTWKKPRSERAFDPSKYSTRLIALKLAYLGKRYNGFEHHTGHTTPLTTIEEELWKALNKGRLIFPQGSHPLNPGEVNWEGCEYSKCGRTDRGVSAFGQVIGIRVRSNRPLGKKKERAKAPATGNELDKLLGQVEGPGGIVNNKAPEDGTNEFNTLPRKNSLEMVSPPLAPSRTQGEEQDVEPEDLALDDPDFEAALNFDPIADEIPYPSLLNRLLPPDIRILAWCPAPPADFSARFSCRERRYRYFFTQPAFPPIPHHFELETPSKKRQPNVKDGWLDIDAMRTAAKLFEGLHDFRNFCKVDPSKQIANFERRIFFADIEEVDDSTNGLNFVNGPEFVPVGSATSGSPKVYTFTLHGSAFLWHQVRCMVSILFLVGQGLEKPSIVSELLHVDKNPRRPTYEMATDTPLVLWDCVFPREDDPERKDAMQWVYVGDEPGKGDTKYGTSGLVDDLWKVWRERKIDEMLAGTLIDVVSKQGRPVQDLTAGRASKATKSQKVFDGGDTPRLQGTYTPVMKKQLMETVDVINEKYAVRKRFENAEDLKKQGFRRLNRPEKESEEASVNE
ncbi:pseudouridine synthase [Mollisia scopiformis]|uniref:Pseudouridine synthase n=1 Tax=Mollisia scopiformis TaxID=149040 RepID=A0A194X687_MOLSC|nr:pseudouridine synthase [Mollisia scopiformis]KUJ15322.1 pseudouridine synthase [Mollisia scopiformis]